MMSHVGSIVGTRESLGEVISRARKRPVRGAPELLIQICEGIANMHSNGWVHGDLNPANVLIMMDGSVRLADVRQSAEPGAMYDYVPPTSGSDYLPPAYWAELLTAQGISIGESADIWAFGVMACQLLTGKPPFSGRNARAKAAAAARYVSSGTPELPTWSLRSPWRRLIADCLAPSRAADHEVTAPRLVDRLDRLREERVPVRVHHGRRGSLSLRRHRPGTHRRV